jgi:hypothetical protein
MSKKLDDTDFCFLLMSALPDLWDAFVKLALDKIYKSPEKLMAKIAKEDNRIQSRNRTNESALAFKGKSRN